MKSILKKALALTLSLLMLFSLFACSSKEEEKKTAEEEKENTQSTPLYFDEYDYAQEIELLDNTQTWLGLSDSGKLEEPGSYQITTIKTRKDLDPYRKYISGLSEKEEQKMFGDTAGKIVLIEFVAQDEHTLYSTNSIQKFGTSMAITVTIEEANEPMESHTYFLLYFPGEIYQGESIEIIFG